jgi:enoyl-CoA hydratase
MSDIKQFNGFRLETGEITLITFNMPRVNIFSTGLITDFINAINTLHPSKVLKVLIITGEGNAFLAGADIKEMVNFGTAEAKDFAKLFHQAMSLLEDFPMPVVAGVNGFALGGGCELILTCDIVIASETAIFGQPEINLGIIPGAGGTQRLTKRIGRLRSKELIFTGRKIDAKEALLLGLINKIVPRDKLMEEVMSLAKVIASKPSQCLKVSKYLINSGSLEKEIEGFSLMFSYEDQKRLMEDFLR